MINLQALQVQPVQVKDRTTGKTYPVRSIQGCKPRYMWMGSWNPRRLRRK